MIFDCFMFSNELEILELRLSETFDQVDRFVLVEATKTHRGFDKPLYFAESRERFRPFLDKIVHIVVDDMPDHADPWILENFQRNAIARGLFAARDEDFIIIGDVDEILRPAAIAGLRDQPQDIVGFQMVLSCFKYNYICLEGESHAVWSVASRARHVRRLSPQYFRDKRHYLYGAHNANALLPEFVSVIPHAGWHFGWIGDHDTALKKLHNTPHQELNNSENVAALDLDAIISSGRDLFNRPGYRWAVMPINDYFPITIQKNINQYSHNIAGLNGTV